jgi:hypothetical protein
VGHFEGGVGVAAVFLRSLLAFGFRNEQGAGTVEPVRLPAKIRFGQGF